MSASKQDQCIKVRSVHQSKLIARQQDQCIKAISALQRQVNAQEQHQCFILSICSASWRKQRFTSISALHRKISAPHSASKRDHFFEAIQPRTVRRLFTVRSSLNDSNTSRQREVTASIIRSATAELLREKRARNC